MIQVQRYAFKIETGKRQARRPVLPVGLACEVAFAGLNFPFLISGADFDAAEASVFHRIGGCVSDSVLAAQLILKLLEGVLQRHLTIDMKDVAAGIFGTLCGVVGPLQ